MAYRIEIAPPAARDLRRLPEPLRGRIRQAIDSLKRDPRPAGCRKVTGREWSYRIRVGPFRVIYEVYDDGHLAVIARVLRRTETTYRRPG